MYSTSQSVPHLQQIWIYVQSTTSHCQHQHAECPWMGHPRLWCYKPFLSHSSPHDWSPRSKKPTKCEATCGARASSTHTFALAISELPAKARIAHIIPGLAAHSLLSILQLCNARCEVGITKIACTVRYRGRLILKGQKCSRTGLWMVPLDTRPSTMNTGTSITPPTQPPLTAQPMSDQLERANGAQEIAANIILTSTKEELAIYLHQCLYSPPKSALFKEILNKQLDSIPGLAYELIAKHLPPSTATKKGHMIITRQGVRSTRSNHQ